ncbi:hypothetical protein OG884_26610 [Streptosporangium sp. NBC_01755]|uniref:hypothetical protein n=1 Tax=Streptosporangium sp. NBC_01755 TaxID=2975949 RepID=UPI002DD88238|nr:hypothetical protein [Streptosporangium sp. NBC_01755]WSC98422.1 hypothetical protein OG884_26610 [Streptosporangium sp. NBC_01755]
MSSRYELHPRLSALQATLAKAERKLPLSQPIRSADLYDEAIKTVDEMVERFGEIIEQARQ